MINCPICHTENIHLDIICKKCGSFLQQKIENINLFEVLWLLIENPRKGLKVVALAKHKNYILFLTALIGISYTYKLFEIIRIYDFINKSLLIFASGLILGIPIGFFLLTILSYITILLSKIFKFVKIKFKHVYTTLAFSSVPIIYILIFVFPMKILAYGANIFSDNPPAVVINPVVYWITEALTYIFLTYFFILLINSIMLLYDVKIVKAIAFSTLLISFIITCYIFFFKFLFYIFL